MIRDQLPGPGNFSGAQKLQQEVIKAISFAEIADSYRPKGSGCSEQTVKLLNFFKEATKHLESMSKMNLDPKPTKKEKSNES